MQPKSDQAYTAFSDSKKIAAGGLREIIIKVKNHLQKNSKVDVLIFDDLTSHQIDFDLRGSPEAILRRIEGSEHSEKSSRDGSGDEKKAGPGRPKLGVVAREVTLLPHHWDWLGMQPGGASGTIRKLVEEAKKKNLAKDLVRQAQDSTYRFMTTMAGDLQGYEEALRLLYAKKTKTSNAEDQFMSLIKSWPRDIRDHIVKLSSPVFRA